MYSVQYIMLIFFSLDALLLMMRARHFYYTHLIRGLVQMSATADAKTERRVISCRTNLISGSLLNFDVITAEYKNRLMA